MCVDREMEGMVKKQLAVLVFAVSVGVTAAGPEDGREILKTTNTKGGLVVHVGCGKSGGKLTAELWQDSRFLVHGVDRDADSVKKAREYILSKGLYGKVSAGQYDGKRLPYADNTVNLLVSEDLGDVAMAEVRRVLVPRGVVYLKQNGTWQQTVKPWPDDIDDWTHWLHDASGNAVAEDRVAGQPSRMQWAAGPRWSRHHNTTPSLNAMVSANGRLFAIMDEAPASLGGDMPDRYYLTARDAFNGLLLWKVPVSKWGRSEWLKPDYSSFLQGRHYHPTQIQRRLVAVGDTVYVTLGFNAPVTALDSGTGKAIRTYGGTENTSEILYHAATLILAVNTEPQAAGNIKDRPPVKKKVMAVDADTGRMLWTSEGRYTGISARATPIERITQLTMAVAGEQTCLLEEDAVVALCLKTGKELWRVPRPERVVKVDSYRNKQCNMCTLVHAGDVVLFGQPAPWGIPYDLQNPSRKGKGYDFRPLWNRPNHARLLAMEPATGKIRWTMECGHWGYGTPMGIYVIDDLVWIHAKEPYELLGVDLASGMIRKRHGTKAVFNSGHHHRCARNKATVRHLMSTRRGVEFTGFGDGSTTVNQWIRGECGFGMLPCNGLIYVTPHPCRCFPEEKLSGFFAFAPAGTQARDPTEEAARVRRGPAFGKVDSTQRGTTSDWPTHRHDAQRSGSTSADVSATLERSWSAEMGARVTPPVAVTANGQARVFVASPERHSIHCLNASDGTPLWMYLAGGPIDSPPTVHEGLVLAGSRDGWVYCLRAADGELVWRLRAGPGERRLVAYDRLESAWPVHGSILVRDSTAFFAAGWSSHLDGGLRVCAFEPATGRIIGEKVLHSEPATSQSSYKTGKLPGILVDNGSAIQMRQTRIDLTDLGVHPAGDRTGRAGKPAVTAMAGMLDDSWFNRAFWAVNNRKLADYLAVDEDSTYGLRVFGSVANVNAHFLPGGKGYQVFRVDHKPPAAAVDPKSKGKGRKKGEPKSTWDTMLPVRVKAMAVCSKTLLLAGPPDTVLEDDPWAAFDGRSGGKLLVLCKEGGKTLAEYELDDPPVFDGLIATGDKVFISTVDGRIECWGGER